MFGVLNTSILELTEKARNNIPVQINGEDYYVTNMVSATDAFTAKARIILTSARNPLKKFEVSLSAVDLSAKFNNDGNVR